MMTLSGENINFGRRYTRQTHRNSHTNDCCFCSSHRCVCVYIYSGRFYVCFALARLWDYHHTIYIRSPCAHIHTRNTTATHFSLSLAPSLSTHSFVVFLCFSFHHLPFTSNYVCRSVSRELVCVYLRTSNSSRDFFSWKHNSYTIHRLR